MFYKFKNIYLFVYWGQSKMGGRAMHVERVWRPWRTWNEYGGRGACGQGTQNNLKEPLLSCSVDSGDQTQEAPLPTEPFFLPLHRAWVTPSHELESGLSEKMGKKSHLKTSWLGSHHPPASTSRVLGLQVYTWLKSTFSYFTHVCDCMMFALCLAIAVMFLNPSYTRNPMDTAVALSVLGTAPGIHLSNKMFCAPPKMGRVRMFFISGPIC